MRRDRQTRQASQCVENIKNADWKEEQAGQSEECPDIRHWAAVEPIGNGLQGKQSQKADNKGNNGEPPLFGGT